MHHPGPQYVSSMDEVHDLARTIQSEGAFAFDVETLGVLHHHSDLVEMVEQQTKKHVATLKAQSDSIIQRAREIKEEQMVKTIALDPHRNEVIWLGLATHSTSWAIPIGHPNGEVVEPEERGDGTTVPPPGYRKILKSGKESMAKARYHKSAEFSPPPSQLDRSEVFAAVRPLFMDETLLKIGHNVKFDARTVAKYLGELPKGPFHDTMLLQHVLDENVSSFSLKNLIAHQFHDYNPYYRHGKVGAVIAKVPFSVACQYVHLDARWTWLLYQRLMNSLRSNEEYVNVLQQDTAVLEVLMHMEHTGIQVDFKGMERLGEELTEKMRHLRTEISASTYPGFNPDSVKDKRIFLFGSKEEGGLGLEPGKQTEKGQASVDHNVLKDMATKHSVVPLLLDWAECKKMKSTYVDGLLEQMNNGRLHPNFHLHRTSTGRLSSSAPNLQNIPRDSSVRGLFRADPGCTLLVADYDQIELRVMAMFSRDPNMMDIFTKNTDIHAGAAALVFGKPVHEVTSEERQIGKATNFLTAYGGGAGKLSATAGISLTHAKYVITSYYEQFSTLAKWKRRVVDKAKRDEYVTTISGRRRRLPYINSPKEEVRARAERQAVNAVVQGSASDICKKAMIKAHSAMTLLGGKVLVQVHDELVVNVPNNGDVDKYSIELMEAMGHGKILRDVPLVVSSHSAETWSEAKE